jgi:predicted nuclease with TOPRIM domain
MKRSALEEKEKDELVWLVKELQMKLKRKHQRLATAETKLGKAKENINRLQGIVTYQRERILELYREQIPSTRDIINNAYSEQSFRKAG